MFSRFLTPFATLFTFFLLLFIYTKIAGPIPFSVNSITTTKNESFNIMGEGKVSVKPDIALVSVGISANAATVKMAQDQINIVIKKVSDSIKSLGLEEKDIQTVNYSINPNYEFQPTQKITGYQANTNLSIKVRNLENIDKVIDTSTANGANQIGGISFDVEDREKYLNEAREKAVTDAKNKASQAAKIGGFSLGRLVNYNESTNSMPKIMELSRGAADTPTPTQVEVGSTEIVINVTLSYEIR